MPVVGGKQKYDITPAGPVYLYTREIQASPILVSVSDLGSRWPSPGCHEDVRG